MIPGSLPTVLALLHSAGRQTIYASRPSRGCRFPYPERRAIWQSRKTAADHDGSRLSGRSSIVPPWCKALHQDPPRSLAALAAARHNPILRPLQLRLSPNGKRQATRSHRFHARKRTQIVRSLFDRFGRTCGAIREVLCKEAGMQPKLRVNEKKDNDSVTKAEHRSVKYGSRKKKKGGK